MQPKNVEIGVVWGGYGSFKVTGNKTIRQTAYGVLFDFNRNYASISSPFASDSELFIESRRLNLPHLYVAPPLG